MSEFCLIWYSNKAFYTMNTSIDNKVGRNGFKPINKRHPFQIADVQFEMNRQKEESYFLTK